MIKWAIMIARELHGRSELFTGKEKKPFINIDGVQVPWHSKMFQILLIGFSSKDEFAKGDTGMETLRILTYLWWEAPRIISKKELAEFLGVEEVSIWSLMSRVRNFVQKNNYPLRKIIEIENIRGVGYYLTAASNSTILYE